MSHIESRPSKRSKTEYDFFVDCEEIQGPRLTTFVDALKDQALSITVHSEEGGGEHYVSHIYSPWAWMYQKAPTPYADSESNWQDYFLNC